MCHYILYIAVEVWFSFHSQSYICSIWRRFHLVRVECAEILKSHDWKVIHSFYRLIGFVDVFSNLILWSGVQTNRTRLFSLNQINAQASADGSRKTTRSNNWISYFFCINVENWFGFFVYGKRQGLNNS